MSEHQFDVVGFSGTRKGMTERQYFMVRTILLNVGAIEIHHGDCVGADAQVHDFASDKGIRTVIHPPTNPELRAFCAGDEVLTARPYLARNRDIVDACTLLVAAPPDKYSGRGGTFSTLRYALKVDRDLIAVYPDGTTE